MNNLRTLNHNTYGCFPVCSSVVNHHAVMFGDITKVVSLVSFLYIVEEDITAERPEGVLEP